MTNPDHPPHFEPSTHQLKIDFEANAAYIRLSNEPVARTRRFEGSESVLVKLDAQNHPVGIEVIGLHTDLPIARLSETFHFNESLCLWLKEQGQLLQQAGWSTGVGDALTPPCCA